METTRAHEARVSMTLVAVLAVYVIPGSHSWSGPVLLRLTATHGVHLADLLVVALGLLSPCAPCGRGCWPSRSGDR
jgi:hypothetical protein